VRAGSFGQDSRPCAEKHEVGTAKGLVTFNGGRNIICLIFAVTPPRDLGLPMGRLGGAAPGGAGDVPAGLPEGAGKGAGAPAQHLDPYSAMSFPKLTYSSPSLAARRGSTILTSKWS
jgi:hypothetical protein